MESTRELPNQHLDTYPHGATQEKALANAKRAVQLWLDTAAEFGDPVPEPKGRRLVFA